MNKPLIISFIQTTLHWENVDKNLEHFSDKIKSIGQTDLIILPEMFTTGFSMSSDHLAEDFDGKAVKWMKETAANKNAAITGSIIFKEGDHYYNRLLWVESDGRILHYDKRHLFTMANEQSHYTPGKSKTVIEYKGWKILPLICYDLRFPVWSRNVEEYDMAIYVANWPERRNQAWRTLLPARAIENQCYVIGVNRVGKDGKGVPYSGDSVVHDFMGNIICSAAAFTDECITIEIDKSPLERFRIEFPVLKDLDTFKITP